MDFSTLRKEINNKNISSFVEDLTQEGSENIKYSLVRCKKEEPLTI